MHDRLADERTIRLLDALKTTTERPGNDVDFPYRLHASSDNSTGSSIGAAGQTLYAATTDLSTSVDEHIFGKSSSTMDSNHLLAAWTPRRRTV